MSHSILLGSLGPDIAVKNAGISIWENNTFIGTWTAGVALAFTGPEIVSGYAATSDEKIRQITVIASAPKKAVKVHIWLKSTSSPDWYKTKYSFAISEDITHVLLGLDLELGDRIAFQLETDLDWELGKSGISIYGVKD